VVEGSVTIQARLERSSAADRRGSPRRKLTLGSSLRATGDPVTIHDFSSAGMLIESTARLPLFDGIEIDLPEVGMTHAVVVWNSGRFYGCEFKESLPKAAISAALLRSRPKKPETLSERRPFVVVHAKAGETKALHEDESASTFEDEERAPVAVRLRVILGSAILLWALIIGAVWSLIKLVR
jgi:hypothetical protein